MVNKSYNVRLPDDLREDYERLAKALRDVGLEVAWSQYVRIGLGLAKAHYEKLLKTLQEQSSST